MRTSANTSKKLTGVLSTMFFNMQQVNELTLVAGDFGVTLMSLYTAIARQPNPLMEDAHIASMLNKPTKTIKNTRLKLTKAGWFERVKVTVKGEPNITYHVGKEAVANSSTPNAIFSSKVP